MPEESYTVDEIYTELRKRGVKNDDPRIPKLLKILGDGGVLASSSGAGVQSGLTSAYAPRQKQTPVSPGKPTPARPKVPMFRPSETISQATPKNPLLQSALDTVIKLNIGGNELNEVLGGKNWEKTPTTDFPSFMENLVRGAVMAPLGISQFMGPQRPLTVARMVGSTGMDAITQGAEQSNLQSRGMTREAKEARRRGNKDAFTNLAGFHVPFAGEVGEALFDSPSKALQFLKTRAFDDPASVLLEAVMTGVGAAHGIKNAKASGKMPTIGRKPKAPPVSKLQTALSDPNVGAVIDRLLGDLHSPGVDNTTKQSHIQKLNQVVGMDLGLDDWMKIGLDRGVEKMVQTQTSEPKLAFPTTPSEPKLAFPTTPIDGTNPSKPSYRPVPVDETGNTPLFDPLAPGMEGGNLGQTTKQLSLAGPDELPWQKRNKPSWANDGNKSTIDIDPTLPPDPVVMDNIARAKADSNVGNAYALNEALIARLEEQLASTTNPRARRRIEGQLESAVAARGGFGQQLQGFDPALMKGRAGEESVVSDLVKRRQAREAEPTTPAVPLPPVRRPETESPYYMNPESQDLSPGQNRTPVDTPPPFDPTQTAIDSQTAKAKATAQAYDLYKGAYGNNRKGLESERIRQTKIMTGNGSAQAKANAAINRAALDRLIDETPEAEPAPAPQARTPRTTQPQTSEPVAAPKADDLAPGTATTTTTTTTTTEPTPRKTRTRKTKPTPKPDVIPSEDMTPEEVASATARDNAVPDLAPGQVTAHRTPVAPTRTAPAEGEVSPGRLASAANASTEPSNSQQGHLPGQNSNQTESPTWEARGVRRRLTKAEREAEEAAAKAKADAEAEIKFQAYRQREIERRKREEAESEARVAKALAKLPDSALVNPEKYKGKAGESDAPGQADAGKKKITDAPPNNATKLLEIDSIAKSRGFQPEARRGLLQKASDDTLTPEQIDSIITHNDNFPKEKPEKPSEYVYRDGYPVDDMKNLQKGDRVSDDENNIWELRSQAKKPGTAIFTEVVEPGVDGKRRTPKTVLIDLSEDSINHIGDKKRQGAKPPVETQTSEANPTEVEPVGDGPARVGDTVRYPAGKNDKGETVYKEGTLYRSGEKDSAISVDKDASGVARRIVVPSDQIQVVSRKKSQTSETDDISSPSRGDGTHYIERDPETGQHYLHRTKDDKTPISNTTAKKIASILNRFPVENPRDRHDLSTGMARSMSSSPLDPSIDNSGKIVKIYNGSETTIAVVRRLAPGRPSSSPRSVNLHQPKWLEAVWKAQNGEGSFLPDAPGWLPHDEVSPYGASTPTLERAFDRTITRLGVEKPTPSPSKPRQTDAGIAGVQAPTLKMQVYRETASGEQTKYLADHLDVPVVDPSKSVAGTDTVRLFPGSKVELVAWATTKTAYKNPRMNKLSIDNIKGQVVDIIKSGNLFDENVGNTGLAVIRLTENARLNATDIIPAGTEIRLYLGDSKPEGFEGFTADNIRRIETMYDVKDSKGRPAGRKTGMVLVDDKPLGSKVEKGKWVDGDQAAIAMAETPAERLAAGDKAIENRLAASKKRKESGCGR